MGKSEPILSYATPESREKTRLTWPALTFLFQFVWLAIIIFMTLGISGPKQVLRDSLLNLAAVMPSIIAAFVNVRSFSWHGCRDLSAGALLSFLFFLVSAGIVVLISYWWVADVLLNPHGSWQGY